MVCRQVKKRAVAVLALTLITMFLAAVAGGCMKNCDFAVSSADRENQGLEETKIKVVATIFPLADVAENVGGDLVEVVTLLPPGANPHVFEVTAEQMRECSGADLYIKVGAGLDDWADKLVSSAARSPAVVVASEGIDLLRAGEHNHGSHYGGGDPHVWLDPMLVKDKIAPHIARALIELRPESKDYFERNLKNYSLQLDRLDAAIRKKLSSLTSRKFVSLHSCWGYFARRYNLEEVATIEEYPGKEPSARWLAGVIDKVKKSGTAGAIFAGSQFNPKAAEVIAEETGLKVCTLDPIGRGSYIETMRCNVVAMCRVLGGSVSKQ